MSEPRDYGRELYPFLYPEAPGAGPMAAALALARQSTRQKCEDVLALRCQVRDEYQEQLGRAADAMAARWSRGGALLAFGNGGSATDAADAAADCLSPPVEGWRPLPALDLTADAAVLSAIGNDVGFHKVFLRQIIAYGRSGDIALGFSTSGNSRNVVDGIAEAARRGLLTVAISGSDGGTLAEPGLADFCFVARSEHIPRIQEGQATLWHLLLELVQERLGEGGP